MRLAHINETTLLAPLLADHHFHRFWVGLRVRSEGWTLRRKLATVVLLPVYPLYYMWLYGRRLRARSPGLLRTFRRHAGHVYLRQLGPAVGQVVGLLCGPGRAAERFTRFEIVEPRATCPTSTD
ncbi:MAG TPA: hypothetical protein P5234_03770 [Thermoanaerobaculaceae bacterium]|nr:hypothetical protein [Thermoanaerobaculaceae bacterium]HRS15348.1 hypothetical protein [Thermoanaerobaculaceae bacterium]